MKWIGLIIIIIMNIVLVSITFLWTKLIDLIEL